MTDSSERTARLLNRREFLTRAAIALGAAAAVAATSRRLSLSSRSGAAGSPASDSLFTPRRGSRLRYWRNKLEQIRLR
jgi:hypothetical protein